MNAQGMGLSQARIFMKFLNLKGKHFGELIASNTTPCLQSNTIVFSGSLTFFNYSKSAINDGIRKFQKLKKFYFDISYSMSVYLPTPLSMT